MWVTLCSDCTVSAVWRHLKARWHCRVNIGTVAMVGEHLMVASVPDRTGYVELCSVCVSTEGTLVHERMRERSKDVLLDSCLLKQHL